jgi:hypothetical protein
VNVPDPSGSSFLFSLVNAYSRPFRLSLQDTTRALSVDSNFGPNFGGEVRDADGETVKFCNLVLMNGKSANEIGGNFSNDHDHSYAYQLDPWKGAPPAGFKLDQTTLAGMEYFAAEEMECYAIPDPI